MTYQERLERKAERLREWAEKREIRAAEAFEGAHNATAGIPMGQPILLGHHSQRSHENALRRSDNKMRDGIEHADKARTFTRRAAGAEAHAEQIAALDALALEPYQIGDRVSVVFTMSHRLHRYTGEIVDATLNFWKVKSITSPYADQGEEPGRIFHAPRAGRKGHTTNNRIEGYAS